EPPVIRGDRAALREVPGHAAELRLQRHEAGDPDDARAREERIAPLDPGRRCGDAAIDGAAGAGRGENEDAAQGEDAIGRAYLTLRESDDLRIARAVGHRFPPAGDDD